MITVLITGAQSFSDFVKDWANWNSLHRIKPDVILIGHGMIEELFVGTENDRRLTSNDDGQVAFANVPIRCTCEFLATTGRDFHDCPLLSGMMRAVEQWSGIEIRDELDEPTTEMKDGPHGLIVDAERNKMPVQAEKPKPSKPTAKKPAAKPATKKKR